MLVLNPAGTVLYATELVGSIVSVIDTTTDAVIATVPVGSNPFGIDVMPTSDLIYVADNLSNNVTVIDAATNTVTATVPAGMRPETFDVFIR